MSLFSQDLHTKIEGLLTRYETKRSAILPALHAIQDEHGWIKEEHVDELHNKYGLNRVHVKEVITFFDVYHDEPTKKHTIRFCGNLTCCMLGAKESIARIKDHIKKYEEKSGGESPFGLEVFPCLGKCDGAPVALVGKDRHELITADKVDEMLTKYAPLPG